MALTKQEIIDNLKQGVYRITFDATQPDFREIKRCTLASELVPNPYDYSRIEKAHIDHPDLVWAWDFDLQPPIGFSLLIGGWNSFYYQAVISMTKLD